MAVCFADQSPTFKPAMRLISSITKANPAIITTTFDHDYVSGTIVRLYIPLLDGMQQANLLIGEITVTGTDTFSINIDTTLFDTFSIPAAPTSKQFVCAQVIPIGEVNSILSASVRNVLRD